MEEFTEPGLLSDEELFELRMNSDELHGSVLGGGFC